MKRKDIVQSVDKCITWIKNQMCTYNKASWGIYERIRVDENQRVCWTRPDCNAEFLYVLDLHKAVNEQDNEVYFSNILSWLLSKQNGKETEEKEGSFNFYFLDGSIVEEMGKSLYQNDNGKVLYCLLSLTESSSNPKILACCKRLADYWVRNQNEKGYYFNENAKNMHFLAKGPCFVGWMLMGMYKLYSITQEEKYLESGRKALQYLFNEIILEDRIRTSYELEKFEDWRPYSSEISILLYALTVASKYEADETLKKAAGKKAEFMFDELKKMQHETGAILNNNANANMEGLTLQVGAELCDLVYTQGFALRALIEYYETFHDESALNAAYRLGEFLIGIQCVNENELWDGAWRGSYNVVKKCWSGRCNQNNAIDEGGMYSIYTGWCCTNIMIGLLQLGKYVDETTIC